MIFIFTVLFLVISLHLILIHECKAMYRGFMGLPNLKMTYVNSYFVMALSYELLLPKQMKKENNNNLKKTWSEKKIAKLFIEHSV